MVAGERAEAREGDWNEDKAVCDLLMNKNNGTRVSEQSSIIKSNHSVKEGDQDNGTK